MRVLLVEDDDVSLKMARAALTATGHQVLAARDGAAAVEILRDDPCPIVVSDWDMPGMDGLELTRAIRSGVTAGYTYVILLTGYNSIRHKIAGFSAGADDFIPKPVEPAELAARVEVGCRVLSLETRDLTIFAMAKLAESRHMETGRHLERVQNYSGVLAERLARTPKFRGRLPADYARLIRQTSPLHDIGKVAIPDAILLKPGPLTPREFNVMMTHTTLGARILDATMQRFANAPFLRMAKEIVLSHHEKFDGTGYPEFVAGDNIPLAARIVGLADAYDAITSRRVYKDAACHQVARVRIAQAAGTHFDPDVVAAFNDVESEFESILYRLNDGPVDAGGGGGPRPHPAGHPLAPGSRLAPPDSASPAPAQL
jgi:putative two-component system response regulator